MTDTTRLKLPLLAAAQSQKHVTVNEALTILDLFAGVINVTNRTATAPTGAESDGTAYVLGGVGTGAWSGFSAGDIAFRIDGTWRRVLPQTGMIVSDAANSGALYRYSSGAWISLGVLNPMASNQMNNLGLAVPTFSAGAMTIRLKQADGSSDPTGASPVIVGLRSSTAGNGNFNQRSATAATSLVVPSGATLGQSNGVAANLYLYLIDNAGTLELAIGGTDLGDHAIVSTTAISSGATSGSTVYSTSARSTVAARKIAVLTNTQATAGTWATAPSTMRLGPFGEAETAFFKSLKAAADAGAARGALGVDLLSGFRNKIINPDFGIAQRGSSFSVAALVATYTLDRWSFYRDGTGATLTVSQQPHTVGQTSVPGNPLYFLRASQSVAGSGGTGNLFQQKIEGVQTLAGKTATLTFWAKADATRSMGGWLDQNFGTGGSPSGTVTTAFSSVALTTAWQKFTQTIAIPSIAGKTLGSSGADGLVITFAMPINTTFTIDFSHLSIIEGDATAEADPTSPRHSGQELEICRRYYQKRLITSRFAASGTQIVGHSEPISPEMRATPTLNLTSGGTRNLVSSHSVSTGSPRDLLSLLTSTGAGDCYAQGDILTLDAEL